MDRINITCRIDGNETELQLDKKAMPGETGPCYMISDNGCFKGYIARRKDGTYRHMGNGYYTDEALATIALHLNGNLR